jgi:hypothetical protein
MADTLLKTGETRERIYTASAGQTDFAVPFHYDNADAMAVTVTDGAGAVTSPAFTMVPSGDYGTENTPGILRLAEALAGGERVEVYGVTPLGRITSLTESQGTPSTKLNREYSNLTKQVQEIAQRLTRGVLARRGETLPDLPAKSALLGKIFWLAASGLTWETLDADTLGEVAEDLALGDASVLRRVFARLADIETLADIDVQLAALGPIAAQLAALAAALPLSVFTDVLPRAARTSLPTVRNDGSALQPGDEIYRSDIDQPMRYYGDGFRVTGFMDTKELTNFVPESARSAVFAGSVDVSPYLQALHDALGAGGRGILPGGTIRLYNPVTFTADGFALQGGGRASAIRQDYADGPVIVLGLSDGSATLTQDMKILDAIIIRNSGDHPFFDIKKVRNVLMRGLQGSGLYSIANWGEAGLTAALNLAFENCQLTMAATHDHAIKVLNALGGLRMSGCGMEGFHTTSPKHFFHLDDLSTAVPRFDGVQITGGNLKGWQRSFSAVDRRLTNMEASGARFDEQGEAAIYLETTTSAPSAANAGFENIVLSGCVNGAGNLDNHSFLKVRANNATSGCGAIEMTGCQSDRATTPPIDIETHISNGAKVAAVQITGFMAKDVRMPDDLTSLLRFKNNVQGLQVNGVLSQSGSSVSTDPLHLVELDLLATVPAKDISVRGVQGDIASGGSLIRDPLGKNRAINDKVGVWQRLGSSSAAIPHTGTTSQTTLATIPVPAGAMGPKGKLRITALWSVTNSANNKTLRAFLGATTLHAVNYTTVATVGFVKEVQNRNNQAAQVASPAGDLNIGTSTTSAVITATEDTATAKNVTLTAQLANSGETITLESYLVEVLYAD